MSRHRYNRNGKKPQQRSAGTGKRNSKGALRMANKGYSDAGASWRKKALKGFLAQSGSAQEDIDDNNMTLRQRSRMLYMASPIAASAIKTARTNVVGIGLQLKSRIDRAALGMSQEAAEEWQRKAEAEFSLWAGKKNACDATGMNAFDELQQLALASWLVSGDVFALIKRYEPTFLNPYSLRLHLLEADRVATPSTAGITFPLLTRGKAENGNDIYDGVEIDKNGMVQAYYFRSNYPYASVTEPTEWTRVLAYGKETGLPNVLHIMDSERPEQYRGVSYLAQVIEPLLQVRRYTESELTAAIIESFFTAFISTESDAGDNPFNEVGPPPEVSNRENDYEMGPGQINIMKPGEKVDFGDPKRPANGFSGFLQALCEQIGAALEIPADLLLKKFGASYSATRGEMLEAWKAFRMRRHWFAKSFCNPVYEIWMSEAVARGRINAPGFFTDPAMRAAYLGAEWVGPSQGQIDPIKEVTAEMLAVQEGFSTREQSTIRMNGGNWESNIDQLCRENAKVAEARRILDDEQQETTKSARATRVDAELRTQILDVVKETMNDK